MQIEPPLPKPLVISDSNEPAGLVPLDESWPEPAMVLNTSREPAENGTAVYGMSSQGSTVTLPKKREEEEEGGVYSLAFDPDQPRTPGVTRSAEWDQASVPSNPADVENKTAESSKSVSSLSATTQPIDILPDIGYRTEIDPLFGDEIKIEVPRDAQAGSVQKDMHPVHNSEVKAAPIARVATGEEMKLSDPVETPPFPENGSPIEGKKKKKKKQIDDSGGSSGNLDTPTTETHMYRLSDAEENRIKLDEPPKNLFFDGVIAFPWETRNLGPWLWLTLGFTVCILMFRLIAVVLEAGGMFAPVGAGALGMASLLIIVFTLSYGCSCWSNTITYTAAGSKSVDWATEGWRDNIVAFLRIGYYFVIAMMMATPLLVFNFIGAGVYLWLLGTLFVFPVFLFSGMASLTFWNFLHGDVVKKLIAKLHQYLLMYGISAAIFLVAGVSCFFAVQYSWMCLIAGPVSAAAWLIYGRLLGRMAYLLQQEPKKKKKKKKKKAENGTVEETENKQSNQDSTDNEKGPREDARGPGGARPV